MRIAIVEDERSYQEHLIKCLMKYEEETETHFQPQIFPDGKEILKAYEMGNDNFDIIFLDVKMKEVDGIEAASEIRKRDADVVLIFITTMAQYAIKGYEVNALDFVLKPISYGQFAMKMKKALNAVKKKNFRYLLLPEKDRKDKVSTDEILYIEVKNHDLLVITKDHSYMMRGSMKEMEEALTGLPFVRCSNAYLVNLKQIKNVEKDTVALFNHELPITRTRKKEFMQRFSEFLGDGYR